MSIPKVISLTYQLRSGGAQGDIIETADKDNPAEFLFGTGNLIKEFEDQIQDLNQGETFEFLIESENAYGPSNPSAIVHLPRSVFTIDGQEASDLLEEGKIIPMRNDQGDPLHGKILEISDDMVKMDFNHPLAGHNLHFKGEVLTTREASSEEIDHGHVHTGHDGH
jgi:FKBP-type peptidyl-prolyl cis-trans isomerase SlyD